MSNLWQKYLRSSGKVMLRVPPQDFSYAVHISLKHKYLYVETPKVACSTIKTTLYRLELEDARMTWEDFEDIHKKDYAPLLKPQQVGNFDAFLVREDIFKFCFVRNPYSRFLSCYLDKIVRKQYPRQLILRQLGHDPNDPEIEISFENFVLAVSEQPVSLMDTHWRPQFYQTYQDGITYNAVGRFENFKTDFRRIGNRISGRFPHFYNHETRHQTGSSLRLREFYTSELQQHVYDIYMVDFEHFGYPRTLPTAMV